MSPPGMLMRRVPPRFVVELTLSAEPGWLPAGPAKPAATSRLAPTASMAMESHDRLCTLDSFRHPGRAPRPTPRSQAASSKALRRPRRAIVSGGLRCCRGVVRSRLAADRARVERVAQPVTEQVEGERGQ